MKNYKLNILPIFEKDLNKIVDYICFQLDNPKAAYSLVDDIYEAILNRLPYAESFEIYPSKAVRPCPYYRIYVKNYIIFYVVLDDVMEIRRILYKKRDREDQL